MNITYRCNTCEKHYSRKSSYDKHLILCNFLIKSKEEKKIINEESSDLPNYMQLVNIVQELSLKYIRLENQLSDMQKWVDKKKKKINVVSWLNDTIHPTKTFLQWTSGLQVEERHFEFLLENTIIQTFQLILEENVTSSSVHPEILPIKCFSQKSSLFYIYDTQESGWRVMTFEDFIKILKPVQTKLLNALIQWKTIKKEEMDNDDKLSILYSKTIIKLMNVSFVQDATTNKIRSQLYNYLKVDLKNLIEYEFEF